MPRTHLRSLLLVALLAMSGERPALHSSPSPVPDPIAHQAALSETSVQGPDSPGVFGSTVEERRRIDEALGRFAAAGLPLPELRIYLHPNTAPCDGHPGLFNQDRSDHRIDLCGSSEFALHELAHAWEHHYVSDATRAAFLAHTGLPVWNDAATPWSRRGVEAAAQVVAWGLLDDSLTAGEAVEYREQLLRYRLLTGAYSPRYSYPPPSAPPAALSDDAAATAAALLQLAAASP